MSDESKLARNIGGIDIAVIVAYFVIVIGFGLWVGLLATQQVMLFYINRNFDTVKRNLNALGT